MWGMASWGSEPNSLLGYIWFVAKTSHTEVAYWGQLFASWLSINMSQSTLLFCSTNFLLHHAKSLVDEMPTTYLCMSEVSMAKRGNKPNRPLVFRIFMLKISGTRLESYLENKTFSFFPYSILIKWVSKSGV